MDPTPVYQLAIFDLSGWHILIILFVALLLFGHKLPDVMRNLGGSVREFKKGMNTDEQTSQPAAPAPTPPAAGVVSRDAQPTATPPSPNR